MSGTGSVQKLLGMDPFQFVFQLLDTGKMPGREQRQAALQGARSELEALQKAASQVDTLSEQLSILRKANTEIPTLRHRVEELEVTAKLVEQLRRDIERLNTEEIDPRKQQIVTLTERVEELTLEVENARQAGVEAGRKESAEALDDLQQKFQTVAAEAKRVPTLEQELHETAKELRLLKQTHEELVTTEAQLRKRVLELEPKLKELEEVTVLVQQLREQIVTIRRDEVDTREQTIIQLREEVDSLTKRVEQLSSTEAAIHLRTIKEREQEIVRLNTVVIHGLRQDLETRQLTILQRDTTIGVAPDEFGHGGSGLRKQVADLTAQVTDLYGRIGVKPTEMLGGSGYLRTIREQADLIDQLQAQVHKQQADLTLFGTVRRYTVGFVSTILSLRFAPMWIARNIANVGSLLRVK